MFRHLLFSVFHMCIFPFLSHTIMFLFYSFSHTLMILLGLSGFLKTRGTSQSGLIRFCPLSGVECLLFLVLSIKGILLMAHRAKLGFLSAAMEGLE
ncbi:hypothetical protein AMELA_G00182790, partial [Ameiurus melas]